MVDHQHDTLTARFSLAEDVAQRIESRIAEEGFGSGHLLGTKDTLRREYGVANATMSEAVRLLSSRGLVTIRPGAKGGIFVAAPTALVRLGRKMLELSGESVSVADCLAVRDALDPLITDEATRHRTAADIRDLRKLAHQLAEPGITMSEYLTRNWELHRRIAAITPNQILRHTYVSLLEFVQTRIQNVTADQGTPTADGAKIHAELVEAIASGNLQRAAAAAAVHASLTSTPRDMS